MYKIAICDDEKSVCSEIEKYIEQFFSNNHIEGQMEVFYSGDEICDYIKAQKSFDLIFLDIELPKKTGIEVGKYIREERKDESTDIIYISSKTNYAMELFKCRPLDFLIKPITYKKVEDILNIVVKRNKVRHQTFSLQIGNIHSIVSLLDILYFQSENKKIYIKLISGEEQIFTGKLDSVEKSLPKDSFLRIHKSFLINYDYVSQYSLEYVRMVDGTVMNISKAYRTEVKRKLMQREMGEM